MQLKTIQKVLPAADVVAGSVIVYHDMKHYELGKYVGEGSVVLSPEGEALIASLEAEQEPKRRRRQRDATDELPGDQEQQEPQSQDEIPE